MCLYVLLQFSSFSFDHSILKPAFSKPNSIPPIPEKQGVHCGDNIQIQELVDYIDWSPFFHAWELHGTYPGILDDVKFGLHAKSVF